MRVYLRAAARQRFALLRGLMDSDGHIRTKGRCEITTVLPRLAEGIGELLASLGIKHAVKFKLPYALVDGVRYAGRPARRFAFMVHDDQPEFRLTRKRARQVNREGRRTTETERRRIVAVEPVAEATATDCGAKG